ncbi:MAG: aminoacyl-histidine dipeptidase [Desulfobacterales bacterium]
MENKSLKVFDIFQKISAIPRCSKNEKKVSAWIIQWAIKEGFDYKTDAVGNLLVSVPASKGYENAAGIILQGHMDMVCEKIAGSTHDFSKDPIELVFGNEWLRAKDTSLGADNGIGLALALAVASDKSLVHPPLELLFTVDEETGLTGAGNIEEKWLKGKILLNIDSEDEGVFIIGCAGGKDTCIKLPLTFEPVPEKSKTFQLRVHGLRGGHSGVDIHEQRANAIKILARCLIFIMRDFPVSLISLNGGSAHNAISREAKADMASMSELVDSIAKYIEDFEKIVQEEFEDIEPDLKITLEKTNAIEKKSTQIISKKHAVTAINLLNALPHGVYNMSYKIPGMVETSSNLATVQTKESNVEIITSQRSNIMSRLSEITGYIRAVSALAGAETEDKNAYPAWQPRWNSPLLSRCVDVYAQLFGNEPRIEVIHAGLECGVLSAKYPGMDTISFGPTIKGAHSPQEKLHIASVEKIRKFLEILISADF